MPSSISLAPRPVVWRELHFVRPLILAAVYLLLLVVYWNSLRDWTVAAVPRETKYIDTWALMNSAGRLFLIPNAIAFAVTLLYLSRTRSLAPVSRNLVPVFFAATLTIPFLFVGTYILEWIIFALQSDLKPNAKLLIYLPSFAPGVVVAQLFRFPREDAGNLSGITPMEQS